MVGIATPFGKAAIVGQEAVNDLIEQLALELKVAMFGVGAKNIAQLSTTPLHSTTTTSAFF